MIHKSLALGIVFLFIITSITPMVIGYNADVCENDEYLDNLAFMCSDEHEFVLINIIHDIDANIGLGDSLYVDEDFIWAGTYNGTVYMYNRENYSSIELSQ